MGNEKAIFDIRELEQRLGGAALRLYEAVTGSIGEKREMTQRNDLFPFGALALG